MLHNDVTRIERRPLAQNTSVKGREKASADLIVTSYEAQKSRQSLGIRLGGKLRVWLEDHTKPNSCSICTSRQVSLRTWQKTHVHPIR